MEGQPQNDNQQVPAPSEVSAPEQQRFKTLGVRLDESTHARLSFIAQLSGTSLADEIKGAIDARLVVAQEDTELIARAEAVQAELQREAEARRAAIAGFFGRTAVPQTVEHPTNNGAKPARVSTPRRKQARGTSETS